MNPELICQKLDEVFAAFEGIVQRTPLQFHAPSSEKYGANVHIKREDLQIVRSYKIRGAFNKIRKLSKTEAKAGIVCASAGNHAQGVAYSCAKLGIRGTVFMPKTTPRQKIDQVQKFGGDLIKIDLFGDTFDDSFEKAVEYATTHGKTFVHPFDDKDVIQGQSTVGKEIYDAYTGPIDYLIIPIGGGGLAAGICTYFARVSPHTKIIGVEPAGAASMTKAIAYGAPMVLSEIDPFVDGAAVKKVGNLNFEICRNLIDRVITVEEGKVCETILEMYNDDAIVVEPAGALSIACLGQLDLQDKNVVCVISGGNNDITRMEEMKEKALLHAGYKHYFIVHFPQRSGALKQFVTDVLGPNDDIVHFEYLKKNQRDKGAATIGIELQNPTDLDTLLQRLTFADFPYTYLNNQQLLLQYLT